MYTILLVIHTILIFFLVALILLQRPEADGMGSLGGGGGNLLSGRASANIRTRTTAILATMFICTSIALAILSGRHTDGSIVDTVAEEEAPAPAAAKEKPPAAPAVPKPE